MWPDILENIGLQIKARLAAINEEIDIYYGGSSGVPTNSQINLIRGDINQPDESTGCANDNEIMVYVDIYINDDIEPVGETDLEYENNRTMLGYKRLAIISSAIIAIEFDENDLGYTSERQRIQGDQGTFRPTCGQRIDYLIET